MIKFNSLFIIVVSFLVVQTIRAQSNIQTEDDYYRIINIPVPEGMLLEVGGVTTLPDGRMAICTRRGDVWFIENAALEDNSLPRFTLFASGLHEPLGLAYRDNALFVAQRGELTKLSDTDGDDKADQYETIYAWPLSGHYHEYSFGPKFSPDGNFYVSTNVAFGDQEWWRGESRVPWRGWTLKITKDGQLQPWATGMRSPAGLGIVNDELFYADNQGDWKGSGAIWHLEKGDFTGHPAGLRWSQDPISPVKRKQEDFYAAFDERRITKEGRAVKPENIQDETNPLLLSDAQKRFPEIKLPAVWLPHAIQGISTSEIIMDETQGKFGPFGGQVFVGDQGQSKIMRVFLEKVKGVYQGVSFDFKSGFQSGVLRMAYGNDGSLYIGETNRGWGSAGPKDSGFQRLVWTGDVPMEMKTIKAMPDGFEIEFTKPINRDSAEDLDSYTGRSFTYKYHSVYGSPTINEEDLKIKGVKVSDDLLKVRLVVENLRQYYIYEINTPGVMSLKENLPVLHPQGFYTLNNIPDGAKVALSSLSTKRMTSKKTIRKTTVTKTVAATKVLTTEEIMPLLQSNTCIACHQVNKKQVGPAYVDVAKRKYSNERIVELIYNPEPSNWPEYATPMAPMPQVKREDALKIAAWINSLRMGD
ncbi:c-type cytochrome [Arenibacter sp. GZD96]|uniref:DUF7133 domain-containing protein n=1 Tax=Aurantibrevibacter litoralis TaxID=3106030 RepID=UPI002AFF3156|nr:c-type cytochrome [Arenibacter sp. GZD-96]MEA1786184.1 c-type cytochrome [Arenibacter sp. GZD-96]